MKVAIEQVFNGSLSVADTGVYDSSKINVTKHCDQYNLGSDSSLKFIGPYPPVSCSFLESPIATAVQFVHPVKIHEDLWWIFGADGTSATATRTIQLWQWTKSTRDLSLVGGVKLNYPILGSMTIRGMRASLVNITSGVVGGSGYNVSGINTSWSGINPVSVGSRIGFGSTSQTGISTWYEVSGVSNNSGIILTQPLPTPYATGTPYIIQDLMLLQALTNSTVGSGGLFITKGLRYEDFQNPTKQIPSGVSLDRQKATYWIKDSGTQRNTTACGVAIDDMVDMNNQWCYVLDSGSQTRARIFGYNFRSSLQPTMFSGVATFDSGNSVSTGFQDLTGTSSQLNNGRVATLQSGPGSGVKSFYFFTSTRVYRSPISSITSGNVNFLLDSMSEVPPGGTATNQIVSTLYSFDIANSIDRIAIAGTTNTGTCYVAKYNSIGDQFEKRFASNTYHLNSTLKDVDSPVYVHYAPAVAPSIWIEDGWMFWVNNITTSTLNQMFIHPFAADSYYKNSINNRIICPKITVGSDISRLYGVYVNNVHNLGSEQHGVCVEPYYMSVRFNGIDTNSGTWIDIGNNGDLSQYGAQSELQFSFTFRTLGVSMIPPRINALTLVYETDDALPSQYKWNFSDTSADSGIIGFVQSNLFNTSVGTHTISIYRSDTDALVMTQASSGTTANGQFQYFSGVWNSGVGSDVIGTRRRFVPSGSLPAGIDLYAKITVG